jgi:uncharacterized protein
MVSLIKNNIVPAGIQTFITWVLLALCLLSNNALAQNEEVEKLPAVKAIARAYPDSIVLRWGPDNPVAWQLANKYGYYLERYTLLRNGVKIENPDGFRLFNEPKKPIPLAEWEVIADRTDYALIAAQAIYGETFELSENYSTDLMQVINKSKELKQRFSFALFAADISSEVAEASGLRYTDKDVKPNEKYVYKVYANVPDYVQKIDTGYVFIGVEDYRPLPKPVKLEADFEDLNVMLSWNKSYYSDVYIAYKVERSDDGKMFAAITDLPIINTESPTGKEVQIMIKSDSLPQNYKTYYYRVKGLTAFGEVGPPSAVVSGFGFKPLDETPNITNAEVINNESVKIQWQFEQGDNTQIQGFSLLRAEKGDGTYVEIKKDIALLAREFVDERPLPVNYYVIKVIDEYGQTKSSFPYLAQLIDSIPPVVPVGLVGEIDTTGLVTIRWNPNTEKDLLGYRVYRSNFKSDELRQVTVDPVPDTVFYDSINIKTLSKAIYYKVRAVDLHYNPSEYSMVLTLSKPDVMPPTPPVFKKVRASSEGIEIQWVNSSSEDVVNHILYRRLAGERGWKLLSVFNNVNADTVYFDKEAEMDRFYEYTILAVDDSKLESEPAIPVKSKRIDTGVRKTIENLFAKADREKKQIVLAWNYEVTDEVERFEIYRGQEDEAIRIYTSLTGESNQFIDEKISVNSNYSYRLRAVYKDGGKTPLSKKIEIKY